MPHSHQRIKEGNLDLLKIQNNNGSASISLFGGHVLQWQPKDQKPVFWMSNTSATDGKNPIRGGIPICWPWFGEIAEQGKHGIVRTLPWTLENIAETDEETRLTLSVNLTPEQNPWGYPMRCQQTLVFGKTLFQEISIENGENNSSFTYALHNYFAVSSPENLELPFINGVPFYDKVNLCDSNGESAQPNYCGPIDRIYHTQNTAELIDKQWNRKISITKTNSDDTVVWNPGKDAANIADIHPGGEQEYICMETAGTKSIKISKESRITIGQTISIETI